MPASKSSYTYSLHPIYEIKKKKNFKSYSLKLKDVYGPLNLIVLNLPCRMLEFKNLLKIERYTLFGTNQ